MASVTVSDIVYSCPIPAAPTLKTCDGFASLPAKSIIPSLSKSHSLDTIVESGEAEASIKLKVSPAQTVSGIEKPPVIPSTTIL